MKNKKGSRSLIGRHIPITLAYNTCAVSALSACSARRFCRRRISSQNPSVSDFLHERLICLFKAYHSIFSPKEASCVYTCSHPHDIFKNAWFHALQAAVICRNQKFGSPYSLPDPSSQSRKRPYVPYCHPRKRCLSDC